MSQEQRQDRFRAGAPGPGSGHRSRSGRPSVLSPTNVYSPGGLLDVPRDGRAPGTPGGQAVPEILRNAGPPAPPPPPAPPGRAGAQPPRPGYQPGMNQGPAARPPYAPAASRRPPRHRATTCGPGRRRGPVLRCRPAKPCRPVTACRIVTACTFANPCRRAEPPHRGILRLPGRSRGRPPPRPSARAGLPRDGMPREAMGSVGPIRPGAPLPPRDPGYQPPPGQHQPPPASTSRHAAEQVGTRPVLATAPATAAGRASRGRRDPPDLPRPLSSLTAGTPTSSARRITRSGRQAPRVRQASPGPPIRSARRSGPPHRPAGFAESGVRLPRH